MLEGLDLANHFDRVAANGRSEDLHGLNDSIWVYEEPASDVHAGCLVVHTVRTANSPTLIRKHWERNAALYHLGQLVLVPDLVAESAVGADRKHLDAQLFQLRILDGNCRQFSRSDESEIAGVEAENYPLAFVV